MNQKNAYRACHGANPGVTWHLCRLRADPPSTPNQLCVHTRTSHQQCPGMPRGHSFLLHVTWLHVWMFDLLDLTAVIAVNLTTDIYWQSRTRAWPWHNCNLRVASSQSHSDPTDWYSLTMHLDAPGRFQPSQHFTHSYGMFLGADWVWNAVPVLCPVLRRWDAQHGLVLMLPCGKKRFRSGKKVCKWLWAMKDS